MFFWAQPTGAKGAQQWGRHVGESESREVRKCHVARQNSRSKHVMECHEALPPPTHSCNDPSLLRAIT